MRKIVFKIFLILNIIAICTIFIKPQYTYATDWFGEIFTGAKDFVEMGEPEEAISEDRLENMSDVLYNVLFVIGVVVAVIVGIGIGIQFMTSGVEQKAKIKETLIAYVAGCVVLFGAFGIWKLVVTLLQSI